MGPLVGVVECLLGTCAPIATTFMALEVKVAAAPGYHVVSPERGSQES